MNSRNSVVDLCVKVGSDFLLAQGAGGNVSWKEKDTLWIKASGTWLKDARENDIFLPLDIETIRDQVLNKNFRSIPQPTNGDKKRPSIETWFHALLPHKFVLHLHALEVLALLVRRDAKDVISRTLKTNVEWAFVEYLKPGEKLASRIAELLDKSPDVSLLFLENHGIVVGAETTDEIEEVILEVRAQLGQRAIAVSGTRALKNEGTYEAAGYLLVENDAINSLAADPSLLSLVETAWAIAPDHVVFLGSKPVVVSDIESLSVLVLDSQIRPKLVFVRGLGVFSDGPIDKSALDQLLAYYEILVRQTSGAQFRIFTETEIGELLNWDAEQYRQSLRK